MISKYHRPLPRVRFCSLGLALALSPAVGHGLDWPDGSVTERSTDLDEIAAFRWARLPQWISVSKATVQRTLAELETQTPTASRLAQRAVLLRLIGRQADCARALHSALALDATVLDRDPDAALTSAWLSARNQQWTSAADMLDTVLARVTTGGLGHESLALEAARWRMSAGPGSVRSAIERLTNRELLLAPTARLTLTLALALARDGQLQRSTALLTTLHATADVASNNARPPNGSPVATDASAALGLWCLAHELPVEAIEQFEIAAHESLPVWRDLHARWLTLARSRAARLRPAARPP